MTRDRFTTSKAIQEQQTHRENNIGRRRKAREFLGHRSYGRVAKAGRPCCRFRMPVAWQGRGDRGASRRTKPLVSRSPDGSRVAYIERHKAVAHSRSGDQSWRLTRDVSGGASSQLMRCGNNRKLRTPVEKEPKPASHQDWQSPAVDGSIKSDKARSVP